jgi:C4-dicarboxylate-specific signal transduction histidine kinase
VFRHRGDILTGAFTANFGNHMSRDPGGFVTTTLTEHRLAAEALARINRATTLGVLSVSIANELNHPLAAIVLSAAACSRWLSAQPPNFDKAQRTLERIANEGRRAGEIIAALCMLVKGQAPRKDRCDLNAAILEALTLTHDDVQRNEISLETSLAEDLPLVECARTQVQQVILNLVINAIQAMRAVAERPRRLAVGSSKEGPHTVRIEVSDSGPGVDPSLPVESAAA